MDMVALPLSAARATALMLRIRARARRIEINFFITSRSFLFCFFLSRGSFSA
jgi:hypothetical protein